MITGGLIVIGILALIAAMLLVRGKGKTSQTNQQAAPKRAADKQTAAPAKPSVSPKAQASFPAPQVPFPVSAANKQTMTFAEPSTSTPTQAPFSAPEVSFPGSTADKQTMTFAEPSTSTPTQTPFPGPQVSFPGSTTDNQAVTFVEPPAFTPTQTPFPGPQVSFPGSTTDNQAVTFVEPPAFTPTQTPFPGPQVPFPGPQVSFPGSTANNHTVTFAEPSTSTPTQTPLSGSQVPFPGPTANKQTVVLTESFASTQTPEQLSFPVQTPPVAQTPGQKAELDQTQVPVDLNDQLTAKPDQGHSETQTLSSIPSEVAPLSPLNPASRSLRHSPSIDQQMAELIADTWALQQQAAEIGRRLNYLSTCIQYSSASEPHEPNTDGNG